MTPDRLTEFFDEFDSLDTVELIVFDNYYLKLVSEDALNASALPCADTDPCDTLPDTGNNSFDVEQSVNSNRPTFGSSDNSLNYDSTSTQYLACLNNSDADNTGRFTMFAVVKVDTLANSYVVHKGENEAANANQYLISLANGTAWFGRIGNGSTNYSVSTTTSVDTNKHLITLQYEPSTHLKLWIDTTLEDTNTTSIPASITARSEKLTIGAHSGSSGGKVAPFDGKIFDVRMVTEDINDAKVMEIQNELISKYGITP